MIALSGAKRSDAWNALASMAVDDKTQPVGCSTANAVISERSAQACLEPLEY